MLDILIQNGIVVDGTGAAPFRADIGVQDGHIVSIGEADRTQAKEKIDAAGMYVSPGLIDIHRHADIAVLQPSFGKLEIAQGITTIVNGQCGLSVTPCTQPHRKEIIHFLEPVLGGTEEDVPFSDTPDYLCRLEEQPLPINVGTCVGNGTLRMAAKGFGAGCLSAEELERVHYHLRAALDAGALGVTMGIVYTPENCYDHAGFVKALAPMRDYSVPLVTHIRGYGDLLHRSLREVIAIAEELGVPLHISHMMAVGRQNWGQGLEEALGILDAARTRGLALSCDVYPYTAGSSQLIQILPPWYQEGGVDRIVERLSDPAMRMELTNILQKPQTKFENLVYASGWDSLLITTVASQKNQRYVGKTIAQIAQIENKTPSDCAFDLLIEEHCQVTMVIFITDEKDILRIIKAPYSSVISDSVYPRSGLPHPRLYGSFPKVFAEYVRDRKLLSLPEAVRKMTSEPAKLYRLGDKGTLRVGGDADIAVFDLDAIGCQADYTAPNHLATGMYRVIVNGKTAWDGQDFVNSDAGRLIRRQDI